MKIDPGTSVDPSTIRRTKKSHFLITRPRRRCRRPKNERILASFQRGENRGERQKSRKIVKIAITPPRDFGHHFYAVFASNKSKSIASGCGSAFRTEKLGKASILLYRIVQVTIKIFLLVAPLHLVNNRGVGPPDIHWHRISLVHMNREGRFGYSQPSNRRFLTRSERSGRKSAFPHL